MSPTAAQLGDLLRGRIRLQRSDAFIISVVHRAHLEWTRVGMWAGGEPQARTTSGSRSGAIQPPKLRRSIRLSDFSRLQLAYSTADLSPCKQKRPRRTVFNTLISLKKSGAGEGIRTLDPNLGKVVLYP